MILSKSKKKILLIFTFILSFFLSSGVLLPKVAADYTVTVGTEWTYNLFNSGELVGTFGVNVTAVDQPLGSVNGTIYLNDILVDEDVFINGTYVYDSDTVVDMIANYSTGMAQYGGIMCTYVEVDESPDLIMRVDISTGVVLLMNISAGMSLLELTQWSLTPVVPTAKWLVEVGDEWTYEMNINVEQFANLGITVTEVPQYPDPPIGNQYLEGLPAQNNSELDMHIYDNETLAGYILDLGTSFGQYGGEMCEYVELDGGDNNTIFIDTATGIVLEKIEESEDMLIHYTLISWSNLVEPTNPGWLVDIDDGWSYDTYYEGVFVGRASLVVTAVAPYPEIVNGTVYMEGLPPMVNAPFSKAYVFDSATTNMYSLIYGTSSGEYGGRTCEYVEVNDLMMSGRTLRIDTSTGIVLEMIIAMNGDTMNFTLVSWSAGDIPQVGEWLCDVGEQFTYEQIANETYQDPIGLEITSVPEWPNIPLCTIYENYANPAYDVTLFGEYYFLDNNSISSLISMGTTEIRNYGGRIRNCVIVENFFYLGTTVYDIDTGILLEKDWSYYNTRMNQTLISWSVSPPGPSITITAPTESELFDTTAPDYNITITDDNLNETWYTLQGGDPIYFSGTNSTNTGTIDSGAWTALPDGTNFIVFYANNTAGNIGFDVVSVIKDTLLPIVTITIPTDLQLYGIDPPSYEVYITEANLEYCWYTLNGGDPIYFSGVSGSNTGIIDSDAWSTLPDGSVTIRFYANDTAGNIVFDEVSISREGTLPIVTIVDPTDSELNDNNPPTYDVTIIEANLDETWYTLNDGDPIFYAGVSGSNTGTIDSDAWIALPDGSVIIRFYANDTAGNLEVDEVTVIKDTLLPVVTIVEPNDSQFYGINPLSYEVDITEANIEYCWYTLNGGDPISFSGISGSNIDTIDEDAWAAIPDGPVVIRFYVNDTAQNEIFDEVSITKDSTLPVVTIVDPTDSELNDNNPPTYDVMIIEVNLNDTWYTLNGGDPISFSGISGSNTGTIDSDAWIALPDGSVIIRFYANDTAGNLEVDEVTVIKDTQSPIVVINSPTDLQEFGEDPPSYDVTITEANLEQTWFTINDSAPIYFSGVSGSNTGIIDADAWAALEDGTFVIKIYASDMVGNVANDEVTITKKVKSGDSVPGYDIYILIGSIGLISYIIANYYRKKIKL